MRILSLLATLTLSLAACDEAQDPSSSAPASGAATGGSEAPAAPLHPTPAATGAPLAAGEAPSAMEHGERPAPGAEPVAIPADLIKPGDAKVGDKTWCPASGEIFTVAADSPKAEYQGKTYYFCCGGCDEEFRAKPEELLKTPPQVG